MQVADSLASIGPIRDLAVASVALQKIPGGLSEARGNPLLLAATGSGRQGALAVLRRGLVPHVITEVPLAGDPLVHSVITLLVFSCEIMSRMLCVLQSVACFLTL